jgi:hypothetical protein
LDQTGFGRPIQHFGFRSPGLRVVDGCLNAHLHTFFSRPFHGAAACMQGLDNIGIFPTPVVLGFVGHKQDARSFEFSGGSFTFINQGS